MHVLMHSRMPTRLAVALIAVLASGCYTYRPVTAPRVSERVRLTLTGQGTEELARFLGPRVVGAEGDLTSIQSDGAMVVAVDFVRLADGTRQPWTGEGVVTFPAGYVTEVRERTFLRRQSYVAGGALTGGLIAVAIMALRSGGAGGNGGGGPPPPPP
jgi:hypothetical protein